MPTMTTFVRSGIRLERVPTIDMDCGESPPYWRLMKQFSGSINVILIYNDLTTNAYPLSVFPWKYIQDVWSTNNAEPIYAIEVYFLWNRVKIEIVGPIEMLFQIHSSTGENLRYTGCSSIMFDTSRSSSSIDLDPVHATQVCTSFRVSHVPQPPRIHSTLHSHLQEPSLAAQVDCYRLN
jgi:hypothetical protein